jgi:hypothetical protein
LVVLPVAAAIVGNTASRSRNATPAERGAIEQLLRIATRAERAHNFLELYRPWPADNLWRETDLHRTQSLTMLLEQPRHLAQPLVRLLRQQGRTREAEEVVAHMANAWPDATGLAELLDEPS